MKREPDIFKEERTYSVWNRNVDAEKIEKLSPAEKHLYFPNDYDPNGMPYGDF